MTPTELDAEVGRLVIAALETGNLTIEKGSHAGTACWWVSVGGQTPILLWGDTWLDALRRAMDWMTEEYDDDTD